MCKDRDVVEANFYKEDNGSGYDLVASIEVIERKQYINVFGNAELFEVSVT